MSRSASLLLLHWRGLLPLSCHLISCEAVRLPCPILITHVTDPIGLAFLGEVAGWEGAINPVIVVVTGAVAPISHVEEAERDQHQNQDYVPPRRHETSPFD